MDKNYCPYCMKKTEETVCPGCRKNRKDYKSSPRQLPFGTILENRYIIGAVLGEGGFGITYLGIDRRLGLRVAIKEYFPANWVSRFAENSLEVSFNTNSKEDFEKGKKRFLREAQTMAMMEKQPDIVGVKDFFEAYGTAYIVMEYVDGRTLKERVKKQGTIPANELFAMVEPIMKALDVMHKAGLTHRDISPDNLMLENGRLRLIDFGCAREITSGDETLTIVLKHGYSPIEQYKHKGQGAWTDVYALSATMYFCLTGTVPPQAIDRLLDDEIIPPNELGAGLTENQEAALLKGMGVKPENRFHTIGELHKALYSDIPEEEPDDQEGPDESGYNAVKKDASEDVIEVIDYGSKEAEEEDEEDLTVFVREEKEKEAEEEENEETSYTKQSSDKNNKLKKILPAAAAAAAVIIVLIILIAVKPWKRSDSEPASESTSAETAAEEEVSEVYWEFDEETGTLTISGSGKMDDYAEGSAYVPWYDLKEEIVSVVIEDGITYIGENNFWDCSGLVSVSLPQTLTEIGRYAFRNCDALEEIILPESLLYINERAVYGCDALTQIDIPASVSVIEGGAFLLCKSLKDINVDEENEVYASDDGIVFSKDMTSLTVYPAGKTDGEYTVPDSVVSITDYAFSGNPNIIQINLSGYVEDIGEFVFYCCSSLSEINVNESNESYSSEGGVLFTNDMKTLICYPCAAAETSYTVPEEVTLIESLAFFNCSYLAEVILPDSVETIGSLAFMQCSALTKITLSASLTDIYNDAFHSCAVTELYIPVSVEWIGEDAFYGCENLTVIYYAGSEEQWNAINDDSNIEELSEATIFFNWEE